MVYTWLFFSVVLVYFKLLFSVQFSSHLLSFLFFHIAPLLALAFRYYNADGVCQTQSLRRLHQVLWDKHTQLRALCTYLYFSLGNTLLVFLFKLQFPLFWLTKTVFHTVFGLVLLKYKNPWVKQIHKVYIFLTSSTVMLHN